MNFKFNSQVICVIFSYMVDPKREDEVKMRAAQAAQRRPQDRRQRPNSHHQKSPPQSHPAAPHLADLANYERRRRNEREERAAAAAAAGRERDRSGHRAGGMPVARVSANLSASPMRKLSEPSLHQPQHARPEVRRFSLEKLQIVITETTKGTRDITNFSIVFFTDSSFVHN